MDVVEAVEAGDIGEDEDPASAASSPEEMPHLPDLVPKQVTVSQPMFPILLPLFLAKITGKSRKDEFLYILAKIDYPLKSHEERLLTIARI